MIVEKFRKTTVLLWALGAAAAAGISGMWVASAQDGRVSAWALVSFLWCVAMLAGLAHHVKETSAVTRYRSRRKPLAGPRTGAELPS